MGLAAALADAACRRDCVGLPRGMSEPALAPFCPALAESLEDVSLEGSCDGAASASSPSAGTQDLGLLCGPRGLSADPWDLS